MSKSSVDPDVFRAADPKERASLLLMQTRAIPRMFAQCREAMLMRVTSILEMAGVVVGNERLREFYAKYGGLKGCAYTELSTEVTDEWAHSLIDEALGML